MDEWSRLDLALRASRAIDLLRQVEDLLVDAWDDCPDPTMQADLDHVANCAIGARHALIRIEHRAHRS